MENVHFSLFRSANVGSFKEYRMVFQTAVPDSINNLDHVKQAEQAHEEALKSNDDFKAQAAAKVLQITEVSNSALAPDVRVALKDAAGRVRAIREVRLKADEDLKTLKKTNEESLGKIKKGLESSVAAEKEAAQKLVEEQMDKAVKGIKEFSDKDSSSFKLHTRNGTVDEHIDTIDKLMKIAGTKLVRPDIVTDTSALEKTKKDHQEFKEITLEQLAQKLAPTQTVDGRKRVEKDIREAAGTQKRKIWDRMNKLTAAGELPPRNFSEHMQELNKQLKDTDTAANNVIAGKKPADTFAGPSAAPSTTPTPTPATPETLPPASAAETKAVEDAFNALKKGTSADYALKPFSDTAEFTGLTIEKKKGVAARMTAAVRAKDTEGKFKDKKIGVSADGKLIVEAVTPVPATPSSAADALEKHPIWKQLFKLLEDLIKSMKNTNVLPADAVRNLGIQLAEVRARKLPLTLKPTRTAEEQKSLDALLAQERGLEARIAEQKRFAEQQAGMYRTFNANNPGWNATPFTGNAAVFGMGPGGGGFRPMCQCQVPQGFRGAVPAMPAGYTCRTPAGGMVPAGTVLAPGSTLVIVQGSGNSVVVGKDSVIASSNGPTLRPVIPSAPPAAPRRIILKPAAPGNPNAANT